MSTDIARVTTRTAPDGGPTASAPARRRDSRIRRDIEGLRAVACLLVLPYHAGLLWFPGGFVGVDVFFVISGFVITGQLLKESDRDGSVSLLGFYARRAKRLLPAAGVVLAATAVLFYALVPTIRWKTAGGDIVASALYFVNWHLAGRQVDYLAEDEPPSVVQHFWSLSVEEQFYALWPILFLAALVLAKRCGLRRQTVLLAGLAVLTVPSLFYAGYMAVHDPSQSYFDTGVRIWEFALGAVVAILVARFNALPQWAGIVLTWGGLAMVLISARLYHSDMIWPGWAALLPTVGAALFIGGGVAAGDRGPVLIIGNRLMQTIGFLTYSLYLWHWPLLIVARERWGEDAITVPIGLGIVLFTAVPAYLTYRLIENPIRNSKAVAADKRLAFSVGLNFTLLGAAAGLALIVAFHGVAGSAPRNLASTPGAASLVDSPPASGGREQLPASQRPGAEDYDAIYPDPLQAPGDVPDLYAAGCQVDVDVTTPTSCTYGPADAATTIAVVGDSKAAQWVPAFQQLAETHDWRIETFTKSACAFATITTSLDGAPYTQCRDWTDRVLDQLTGPAKPDYVVTVSQRSSGIVGTDASGAPELSRDAMVDALADTWGRLEAAGVKVVSLADTPQTGMEVYTCVSEHPDDYFTACTFDRAKGISLSGAGVQKEAAEAAGVPFIDMTPDVCPPAYGDRCPPVIGNVLIYRQGSHITKTYIETMSDLLYRELRRAGVPG